jgi:hypothetical protein
MNRNSIKPSMTRGFKQTQPVPEAKTRVKEKVAITLLSTIFVGAVIMALGIGFKPVAIACILFATLFWSSVEVT